MDSQKAQYLFEFDFGNCDQVFTIQGDKLDVVRIPLELD